MPKVAWIIGLVTLLVLTTLGVFIWHANNKKVIPAAQPITVLSSVSGNVQLLKAGSTSWTTAPAGTRLGVEDSLKTGEGASATVTFFEGSTIELSPDTEITIRELSRNVDSPATSISLSEKVGKTLSQVTKFVDPASHYEIVTPTASSGVRGSTMLVIVAPDGTTYSGNIEGQIFVKAQGVELDIPQGKYGVVKPGKPPILTLDISIPTLISPKSGEVVDNGKPGGQDHQIWDFDWEDVPGATDYNLYVIRRGTETPAIDTVVTSSTYHRDIIGYVINTNLLGWTWKVRARIDGNWQDWSEIRDFSVEPLNTALLIPTLVSPKSGAVMDNGEPGGENHEVWDFDWEDVPGASDYNLLVNKIDSQYPVLDIVVTPSQYHRDNAGYIHDLNRFGWTWKVRAKVNDIWQDWSETREFTVAPMYASAIKPSSDVNSGTVSGRVLWNEQPLQNATVYAQDPKQTTRYGYATTDANGRFSIGGIPQGKATILVWGNNSEFWVASSLGFTLTGSEIAVADIYMPKGFYPTSPTRGQVLTIPNPTLSWALYPGAVDYAVRIIAVGANTFIFSRGDDNPRFIETSVTVNVSLPPGEYQWRIDAFNAQGHIIGASYYMESNFIVKY